MFRSISGSVTLRFLSFLLYFYLYPEDFFFGGGVKENWIRPRVNAVQNTS